MVTGALKMHSPELVAAFHVAIHDYSTSIQNALVAADLKKAQHISHKVLGLCQIFDRPDLAELCESLENAKSLSSASIELEKLLARMQ